MIDFLLASFVCFFAMYGIAVTLRDILEKFRCKDEFNGLEHCIYVKNAEKNVEVYIRDIIFKYPNMKNLIVVDMDSTDGTYEILERLRKEFEFMRVIKYQNLDLLE